MNTANELINLIDETLEGKFGKSSATEITLPNGKIFSTDVGYVEEFWESFKKIINIEKSELTIKEVWPKLKEFGVVELRINNSTVWSDTIMDVMFNRADYHELLEDYLFRAENELLSDLYENFRITSIHLEIVDFHHCVADIKGYYEKNMEEKENEN